jgi:hypothetical protein
MIRDGQLAATLIRGRRRIPWAVLQKLADNVM